jgi:hypothetical protein
MNSGIYIIQMESVIGREHSSTHESDRTESTCKYLHSPPTASPREDRLITVLIPTAVTANLPELDPAKATGRKITQTTIKRYERISILPEEFLTLPAKYTPAARPKPL